MKQLLKKLIKYNYQARFLNNRAYSHLKDCTQIIDIGCGPGDFLSFDKKKTIGLDINQETLTRCSSQGYMVAGASATQLPFATSSIEGIHCSHVIEHMSPEAVYQFLSEISRVLKQEGIVVIRTPILWSGFYDNLTHVKPYNPKAIKRYLVEKALDTTFPLISSTFVEVAFYWRYRPILNMLYPLGIHTGTKDAYMLVLKKIRND